MNARLKSGSDSWSLRIVACLCRGRGGDHLTWRTYGLVSTTSVRSSDSRHAADRGGGHVQSTLRFSLDLGAGSESGLCFVLNNCFQKLQLRLAGAPIDGEFHWLLAFQKSKNREQSCREVCHLCLPLYSYFRATLLRQTISSVSANTVGPSPTAVRCRQGGVNRFRSSICIML